MLLRALRSSLVTARSTAAMMARSMTAAAVTNSPYSQALGLHSFSTLVTNLRIPSTLDEMKKRFPLWEDEDVALLHRVYRDLAKDLLHVASFRLKNKMIDTCMCNNPLFADMIAKLMNCSTEQDLIDTVRQQLLDLFPYSDSENGEKKMTYYFTNDLKAKVQGVKNWEDVEDLRRHMLFCSLEVRTLVICGSLQHYRNFTDGNSLMILKLPSPWVRAYNAVVELEDPTRLANLQYPLGGSMFTNPQMADSLNEVWEGLSLNPLYRRRACYLLLFRNGVEHINQRENPQLKKAYPNRFPRVYFRISRHDTIYNLHKILGCVSLDVQDFNKVCKLNLDLEDRHLVLENVIM